MSTPKAAVFENWSIILSFFQLHLVHWDYETHSSFKAAVGGGNPNDLSVLGFFLKVTYDHLAGLLKK